MPATLIKRWQDWSAGVGYPIDDGTPGMHTANKLLGLRGELRPAPAATDVTVAVESAYQFQYFFEEPETATPTVSTGNVSTGSGTGDLTISNHAVAAGNTNRMMVVLLATSDTNIPINPTLTYGGTTLAAFAARGSVSPEISCAIFYLLSPDEGTADIVIDVAGASSAIVATVIDYYDVDQSSPFGDWSGVTASGTSATRTLTTATGEVLVDAVCVEGSENLTAGADQLTNDFDATAGAGDNAIAGGQSDQAGADGGVMSWSWPGQQAYVYLAAAILPADRTAAGNYLYAINGRRVSGSSVKVKKISLKNEDFANLETGEHDLTPLAKPGQPVRHSGSGTSGGFWHFPLGDNQKARKLSVIGTGAVSNDTLDATGNQLGADHYANLDSQVVASLAHSSNDDGGLRILKVGGDITTEADWGSAFATGDRSERAAGLRSLGGASFVLNVEGLYSFNKQARSGLVFEDFRTWRHVFDNIPIVAWKGGLVLSHPTGLLFYEPGRLPVNIGLNADVGRGILAPSGPPELRGGRYHGLAVAGNFLYNIYQPDISSTTVNVMVSYPRENSPYDLIHQQLGTATLQDTDHMLGCFVSVGSKPRSAEYVTPSLWYGNDDDLSYKVLGTDASPFRTRTDTHIVETAGDGYMSELLFERPTELSHLVVYAQNMASGDEWQLKIIADGEEEKNVGPPIKRNGREIIKIERHDVYRLMLHVNWASTVSTARVAPSIQRIELYGPTPVTGKV